MLTIVSNMAECLDPDTLWSLGESNRGSPIFYSSSKQDIGNLSSKRFYQLIQTATCKGPFHSLHSTLRDTGKAQVSAHQIHIVIILAVVYMDLR